MSNISLRLPYLIYLSIASILVGVLIAPLVRDVPAMEAPTAPLAMAHSPEDAHVHGSIEVAPEGAPQVDLTVEADPTGGWNVTLDTANFTFTPETVNAAHVPGTGHAHLYVDGVKVARLYSAHFHLADLPPGPRQITVSLNTNDHMHYVVGGQPVEAHTIVNRTKDAPAPQS